MRKKRIIISATAFLLFAGAIAYWWNDAPGRRWWYFSNQSAFCKNCSSFVMHALREYSEDHHGWYPQGGKTPLDSLTRLLAYENHIGMYTSHALAGKLRDYHKLTGKFSEQLCCYRYNEGLQSEDPEDLIILYYYKPTYWQSQYFKGRTLGRQVLRTPIEMRWDFITEDEFQKRQRKTEAYLRERKRREPELALVASNLMLAVTATNLGENTQRFSAGLRNRGSETAVLQIEQGNLIHREGGGYSSYFLEKEGTEIRLSPGQVYTFPGWLEVTVEDEIRNGKTVARSTRTRNYSGVNEQDGTSVINTGQSHSVVDQPPVVGTINSSTRFEASLRASVEMGSITNLQIVLKSQKGPLPGK